MEVKFKKSVINGSKNMVRCNLDHVLILREESCLSNISFIQQVLAGQIENNNKEILLCLDSVYKDA